MLSFLSWNPNFLSTFSSSRLKPIKHLHKPFLKESFGQAERRECNRTFSHQLSCHFKLKLKEITPHTSFSLSSSYRLTSKNETCLKVMRVISLALLLTSIRREGRAKKSKIVHTSVEALAEGLGLTATFAEDKIWWSASGVHKGHIILLKVTSVSKRKCCFRYLEGLWGEANLSKGWIS